VCPQVVRFTHQKWGNESWRWTQWREGERKRDTEREKEEDHLWNPL